jgi:zinc D-Ala-D-Ala carboxypeptidase
MFNWLHIILGTVLLFSIGVGVYVWLTLTGLEKEHAETTMRLNETQADLASSTKHIKTLTQNLDDTTETLQRSHATNEELADELSGEKLKNEAFRGQIENISGTVGQLNKLAKTDPELLQKYSKVFFLNEHYRPEKLVGIPKKYLYIEDEPEFVNVKVATYLEDMLDDALRDNINLWVASAYRSFDEQASLKGEYVVTYGSGANTFSADQGYSEHQLGTTIDFLTNGLNGGLQGFETTPAYEWLLNNAYMYGFTLSYPENNQYYVFEPWHWRFVGTKLAEDLFDDRKHFYDLDQRDIDEYLISLFD